MTLLQLIKQLITETALNNAVLILVSFLMLAAGLNFITKSMEVFTIQETKQVSIDTEYTRKILSVFGFVWVLIGGAGMVYMWMVTR